jgi:CMP-N-acetylneuraminic acid synthetase
MAIIPARGGSKRLPKKNIMPLCEKPLIGWTIEASIKSNCFDEVIVSSDDDNIIEIAKKYGASVPFIRPKELASDTATSYDVVKHAVEFYKNELNKEFDFIVILQPTSPLRTAAHIQEAIKQRTDMNADAIVSVCEVEHSPLWMNTLPDDKSMNKFIDDKIKNLRSQDLPKYYRLNGAIYIAKTDRFLQDRSVLFSNNIFAYIMNMEQSVDIDNKIDFALAEILMKSI